MIRINIMQNESLQEKLTIIDELSKSYQRIVSVNKDQNNGGWDFTATKILYKINNVVDSIEKNK